MPDRSRVFLVGWIVFSILITTGSLVPIEDVPKAASLINNKIQHGGAYFLLGLLGWQASTSRRQKSILVLLSAGLGVGIEYVQPLTGRTFEWADMAANTVGLILAVILSGFLEVRFTPKNRIKL